MCSGASSGLTGVTMPAVAPAISATGASIPFGSTQATVSPGPIPEPPEQVRRPRHLREILAPGQRHRLVARTRLSWKVIAGRSGNRPAVSATCS